MTFALVTVLWAVLQGPQSAAVDITLAQTPEMNRALETTDTPFGRVVQPLRPYRRTFAALRLWSPAALFEHRAVLYTSADQPFSEVDEVYKGGLLAFARAPR